MEICSSKAKEYHTEREVCGTPSDEWSYTYYFKGNSRDIKDKVSIKYCKECHRVGKEKRKCLKCNELFKKSCGAKFLCKKCYLNNKRIIDPQTFGTVAGKDGV